MHVSVEATTGLERRMTVEVPAERIEQEIKTRLKSLASKARLDGFRPGKIPFSVVEQKFAGKVRSEVLGDMIRTSFQEALSQEKLRPAGGPKIETLSEQPEQGLAYTATFEVYPEIALAPLDKVVIDKPVVEITEHDVDNMLEKLRRQRPSWKPAQRPAQTGDQLQIEFKAHIAGAESTSGPSQQTSLILGGGTLPKEIEEKLLGLKPGDETTIDRPAAADAQEQPTTGKPISKYTVKVVAIFQPDLPALDAEFVKTLGVESGDMATLRIEVRGNMERELEQAINAKLKQQIMDVLVKNNPVEIPKAPLEHEIDTLIEQANAKQAGKALARGDYESTARRRVALGLIIGDIIKAHSIKPDPARVRVMVESLASTYEDSEEVIKWYYSSRERLMQMESLVLEDQVVDWILERAQVNNKTSSFDAVINPEPASAIL